MIIYALIDPRTDAVRYIGKSTRTAHLRLRRHLAPSHLTGETHKERWIRGLLRAGLEPRIQVLKTCASAQELNDAERAAITEFLAKGADLTNATPGGDGLGAKHTEASKRKISAALTGRARSAEHRRRIGLASKGRVASEITRQRLSDSHKGQPGRRQSEADRIALSRAKGGRPFVDQFGNRYETQNGAARSLGLNLGHVNEVLHGRRRHVAGYVFVFIDGDSPALDCVRQFPEVSR